MAYDYDKLYRETPNALGAPSQPFVTFFQDYDRPAAAILDIGCGQGRDALFIARLGHHVTAVDMSPAGIAALTQTAKAEALNVTGIVADITTFAPTGKFDVIVIDRTLHMLAQPTARAVLDRLITHVASDGHILIADEKSNMAGFRNVLEQSGRDWKIAKDDGAYLFATCA